MDGKIINMIPTDLSTGGIMTPEVGTALKNLQSKLGKSTLSVAIHSGTYTNPDWGHASGTIAMDVTAAGKTPIAIIAFRVEGNVWRIRELYLVYNSDADTYTCRMTVFRNEVNSAATTCTGYVRILYVQN